MGLKLSRADELQFDLEQGIMNCWSVLDDLKVLINTNNISEDDLLSLSRLYQIKFEYLFSIFESYVRQKHVDRTSSTTND